MLASDGWVGIVYAKDAGLVKSSFPNERPLGENFVIGRHIADTLSVAVRSGSLYGTSIKGAAYNIDPYDRSNWRNALAAISISSMVNSEKFAFLNGANSYHTGLLAGGTLYHSPGMKEDSRGIVGWVNYLEATQIGSMMLPPDSKSNLRTYEYLFDILKESYRAPKVEKK